MEIRSVTKAVRLLEALANEASPVGVSELGRQLAMDKASVSRMLRTLEQAGFVAQDTHSQRYSLGVTLVAMGQKALKRLDLRDAARPSLESLVNITGECAHIAMMVADKSFYLDQLVPERGVSVDAPVGTLAPLHCTALGKAMLAFQPKEIFTRIFSELDFEFFTRRTIVDPVTFSKHLAKVRRTGVAHDDEEFSIGVRCIAAPVFRHDGRVCGAIGISGPSPRVTDDKLSDWETAVRNEAILVTARMGFNESQIEELKRAIQAQHEDKTTVNE
ncbi:MAG: IclR family transcriptional regulator [Rhizobiaceae bacterium]|nr:IclR family transcriptional regulator [Rhizobiaceae bacterium]